MPHSRRTWKDSFLERFFEASPVQSAATTGGDVTAATASASFNQPTEEPPSSSLQAEATLTQKKESCGAACRCHAGDLFPDHSICPRSSKSSRPQSARLLSMIQEAPPTTTSELPSPTALTLSSTNSTASPATPSSRRHSLYFPSENRPVFDEGDDYSRGRGRGRKSSESSMFRMGTYGGLSPRTPLDSSLEKSQSLGQVLASSLGSKE